MFFLPFSNWNYWNAKIRIIHLLIGRECVCVSLITFRNFLFCFFTDDNKAACVCCCYLPLNKTMLVAFIWFICQTNDNNNNKNIQWYFIGFLLLFKDLVSLWPPSPLLAAVAKNVYLTHLIVAISYRQRHCKHYSRCVAAIVFILAMYQYRVS